MGRNASTRRDDQPEHIIVTIAQLFSSKILDASPYARKVEAFGIV
jgi:hypothetical protein